MGQYKSQHTGPQIDAGVDAALNPDVTVTPDSDALVTSGAVADALDNIDPTITSNTDTTLNGILVGDSGKVGTKSLDTSSLTNDADHVPVSSIVKNAITNVENEIGIVENGNTASQNISAGQYVIWKGALYTADSAIASGATLASSGGSKNLTAVSNGGLNDLRGAISIETGVSILLTGQNWSSLDWASNDVFAFGILQSSDFDATKIILISNATQRKIYAKATHTGNTDNLTISVIHFKSPITAS